ncbi:MAG: T9SS type A sorting domain-containing protein [Ferruginibacter sp.]
MQQLKLRFFLFFVLAFTVVLPNETFAQAGRPDLSFNTADQGYNNINGGANNAVKTIIIQPDGKIIIGGGFTTYNGQPANYLLRINADGSKDATFNTGGSGPNATVKCIALQADGKLLIGGIFTTYNGSPADAIICLNADGSPNRTYTTTYGFNDVPTINIQPDGRLLVGRKPYAHLVRINLDGTTDAGFHTSFGGYGPYDVYSVYATAIQSDGKIIAVGEFQRYATGSGFSGIVRLNYDGTRDTSFNNNRPLEDWDVQATVGTGVVNTVFIQPNGKIIIGGVFSDYSTRTLHSTVNNIARLNIDGSVDASFNAYGAGTNGAVNTMALQQDGKTLIGGAFTSYNGTPVNRLVRLNTDGSLDNSFNFNKTATDSTIFAMAILPGDNKFLIGGAFSSYNSTGRNKIARLHNCSTTGSVTNVSVCTNQLPYTWNSNTYAAAGTYTKTFNNPTGCDSIATLVLNPSVGSISGPTRVCVYTDATGGTAVYSVTAAAGSTFTWTVSKTATMHILSGQGTNTIQMRFTNDFTSGNVYASVKNIACGFTIKPALAVNVSAPSTPSSIISGTNNICAAIGTGNAVRYTISKVAGATSYNWTAQTNTTGIIHTNGPGINDTTIEVIFENSFSSSPVTVQAVNDCGISNVRSLNIVRPVPTKPGTMSGPTFVCDYVALQPDGSTAGGKASYSVPSIAGAQYTWTVPAGSFFLAGQGSNYVTFKYPVGFTSGPVSVTTVNGCGASAARLLNVTTGLPGISGAITQTDVSPCPGRQYTYSIPSIPSHATAVYWYLPTGDTILTSETFITVTYPDNAVTGFVSVQARNGCGYGSIRKLAINLPACGNGFTRNSEAPAFSKINTATPAADMLEVKIAPNPTVSDFKLQVITSAAEKITVSIFEIQGRLIKQISVTANQLNSIGSDLNAGTYILEVRQGKNVKTTKLIKF